MAVKNGGDDALEAAGKLTVNKADDVARVVNVTKGESKIWKSLSPYKGKAKRTGTGRNTRYYNWDHLHNDIEVFDHNQVHIGSMHPVTGEMYKGAQGHKLRL